jgi:hypothetical protein
MGSWRSQRHRRAVCDLLCGQPTPVGEHERLVLGRGQCAQGGAHRLARLAPAGGLERALVEPPLGAGHRQPQKPSQKGLGAQRRNLLREVT